MIKSQLENSEKIFIPDILNFEDIERVLEEIDECQRNGKIKQGDYILVDELNGEINIKVFVGEIIDTMARKIKITPKEVLMDLMRDQNKEKPEFNFREHEVIRK